MSHMRSYPGFTQSTIPSFRFQQTDEAFRGAFKSYRFNHPTETITDYLYFLDEMMERCIRIFPTTPTKFSIGMNLTFMKDGVVIVPKFPVMENSDVLATPRDRFADVRNRIIGEIEKYTQQSNLIIHKVERGFMNLYRHNHVQGSSYKPLPKIFSKHSGLINPINRDPYCFYWSCGFATYVIPEEDKKNPGRISPAFKAYMKKFRKTNTDFPMIVTHDGSEGRSQFDDHRISKYEKVFQRNIHIWTLEKKDLIPLRVSRGPYKEHITLFYWDEHFAYVKNESAFLTQFSSSPTHASFMCYNCLSPQSSQVAHDNHVRDCQGFATAAVQMPEEGEFIEFKKYEQTLPLPVVIYADGESIQSFNQCTCPKDCSYCKTGHLKVLGEQHMVSMGMVVYDRIQGKVVHEAQYDNVRGFIDAVKHWSQWAHETYFMNIKPMIGNPPASDTCCLCQNRLGGDTVRHHCHYTGKPIGLAHNGCNLNCKDKALVPVVFHNGKGYDSHFIIRQLLQEDAKSISALPDTFEKWKAFSLKQDNKALHKSIDPYYTGYKFSKNDSGRGGQFFDKEGKIVRDGSVLNGIRANMDASQHNKRCQYEIRFIDSLLFLGPGASLDKVTQGMRDKDFKVTRQAFPDKEQFQLLRKKGFFPYEWYDSLQKLEWTCLPPLEAFVSRLQHNTTDFNKLTGKQQDELRALYHHAQVVWETFDMKTFRDYHDLYLRGDVLLLTDMMEAYRDTFLEGFGLDPFHSYTLPGAGWQAMLKMTRVKIPLLHDQEMYMFFEKALRGGVSFVGTKRYAEANNPHVPRYKSNNPHSWLLYIDMNSLYAHVMRRMKLAIGEFMWMVAEGFDLHTDCTGDYGYHVDISAYLPDEHHDKCKEYPGMPEILEAPTEWYSPLQMDTSVSKRPEGIKLIPTLLPKERYVVSLLTLQQYMKQGWVVTKVHRVVRYRQSDWMERYISYCIDQRTKAKTDFSKDFWKLLCNSVFGKTMQNVRGYRDVTIIKDGEDKVFNRITHSPGFMRGGHVRRLSEGYFAVERKTVKVLLNSPIYLGASILDLSKLAMHRFWYDTMVPRYGDKLSLVYTDTDSFIFHVETPNVYTDLASMPEKFDFSNIDPNHPIPEIAALSSQDNKKLDGVMKIEGVHVDESEKTYVRVISRVVALRPKMYGIESVGGDFKCTAKGCPGVIQKSFNFDNYMDALWHGGKRARKDTFHKLSVREHRIFLEEHTKITLGCFTDKSYLLEDGISQLPYGHYSLRKRKWDEVAQEEFYAVGR